jgi:hypothetical protein
LLGTGEGGAGLDQTVKDLFQAAIFHLKQNPESLVEEVYFLAWSDVELKSCLSYLENTPEVKRVN